MFRKQSEIKDSPSHALIFSSEEFSALRLRRSLGLILGQEMSSQTQAFKDFSLSVCMGAIKSQICMIWHLTSLSIYSSVHYLRQQRAQEQVSGCVLFPYDLPLTLKQEYIICEMGFGGGWRQRWKGWDGLFNCAWLSANCRLAHGERRIFCGFPNLILGNIWEISCPVVLTVM